MPRRSLRIRNRDSETSQDEATINEVEQSKKLTPVKEKTEAPSDSVEVFPSTDDTSDDVDVDVISKTVNNDNDVNDSSDSDSDIDSFADDFAEKLAESFNLSQPKDLSHNPSNIYLTISEQVETLSSSIDVGDLNVEGYISVDSPTEGNRKILNLYAPNDKNDPVLKYSVITPDFEAKHHVPIEAGKRALKKQRKQERDSTSGKKWFNMKAPEMTEEVKRDMKILQMRSILDPKRFYKKNDRRTTPKYFQIGKIMDNSADFYSSRVPKKQRKSTLADELLADANFKRYQKKKYNEIQAKRRAMGGYHGYRKRKKDKM